MKLAPQATSKVTPIDLAGFNLSTIVQRDVTLAELGFARTIVMGGLDTQREFYLPVPPLAPIQNAALKLDANYLRSDGGKTALILLLDNDPISSRSMTADKGDASLVVPIDGRVRTSNSVLLSVIWKSIQGEENTCTDGRSTGNFLRIEPTTRFSYQFDAKAVTSLNAAWGTLPPQPTILIARNMSASAYDSAWRIGAALIRSGKKVKFLSLPAVGDVVDLSGTDVPQALRGIPAYAVLANSQTTPHTLNNLAEVGALLTLSPNHVIQPDLVIREPALLQELKAAADALHEQLQMQNPGKALGFAEWRRLSLDVLGAGADANQVRLMHMLGRPVVEIPSEAGAKAAALYGAQWQPLAINEGASAKLATDSGKPDQVVSLKSLGAKIGTIDVLARSDWTVNFDLGALAQDGRVPVSLELDLSAAPGGTTTRPVASVFLNDTLLSATRLEVEGKPERLRAVVPHYALLPQNVLRVSFVRQQASAKCYETPEAYPVSILPSSHFVLGTSPLNGNFTGMTARFGGGALVLVPQSYLADAQDTLPRVARLATTIGISPVRASFKAESDGASGIAPASYFLAFDLNLKDQASKAKLGDDQRVLTSLDNHPLVDVKGLNRIALAEVIKSNGVMGIHYRSLGKAFPPMDTPIQLNSTDIAVFGPAGLLAQFDSTDPTGKQLISETAEPFWQRAMIWWLPLAGVVLFVLVLVIASWRRRRLNAVKD